VAEAVRVGALAGGAFADAAAQVAVAGDEAARHQPGGDPARVGTGRGDDVVDVVQAAGGRLRLQAVDDELADPRPAPAGGDEKGDLGVAPLGIQPAVLASGYILYIFVSHSKD
jgi:hypothetical protein